MERATTLIFPSYKDLAHNEPAVEVLKQSRFVREGKAFIEERASNQSKQPDVTEAQHILILSYPEKDVLQKESVEVRANIPSDEIALSLWPTLSISPYYSEWEK